MVLSRAICLLFVVLGFSTALWADDGEALFVRCAVCHQPGAEGIPGVFPSLAGSLGPIAATPEGRAYLVMVVKAGLIGEIRVAGQVIQGVMPPQGFDDTQIAAVLNHVITRFNAASTPQPGPPFSAAEVAGVTAQYPGMTGHAVAELRTRVPGLAAPRP